MQRLAWVYPALVGACLWAAGPTAWAADRHRVEERPLKRSVSFLPAAASPQGLNAPVLSGPDYTQIAPRGARLRLIEDEPYIRLRGSAAEGPECGLGGVAALTLRADLPAKGWYEARVNLRHDTRWGDDNPLPLAFDTAANYVYTHDLVHEEERGQVAYALSEVRSPLGLTDPKDKEHRWREYLAYTAAVINPLSAESASLATPYRYVRGQLKALRRLDGKYYLLTIDFEAKEFANALTLTENIARCVINRLLEDEKPGRRLAFLEYYPEFERAAVDYAAGERIDPRVADLAERPGEGCGAAPLPFAEPDMPPCPSTGPHWPAEPYVEDGAEVPGSRGCAATAPDASAEEGLRCCERRTCTATPKCRPRATCTKCTAGRGG